MLAGKTALVTGASRGIGLTIAERLAEAGVRVVVTGRNAGGIEEVAKRVGGVGIAADLADRGSIAALIDRMKSEGLAIDVLVNNAGVADSAPYDRASDEMWDRTMEINAHAPFALCRALVPGMVARAWGRVVNVASNAGRSGYAYTSAYCASKHAVVGLTRALAAELARTGVTVNAVCPGWVKSDMSDEAVQRIAEKTKRTKEDAERDLAKMSPQKRMLDTSEVAHLVLSLCAHEARGINGQAIVLDGGQVMA